MVSTLTLKWIGKQRKGNLIPALTGHGVRDLDWAGWSGRWKLERVRRRGSPLRCRGYCRIGKAIEDHVLERCDGIQDAACGSSDHSSVSGFGVVPIRRHGLAGDADYSEAASPFGAGCVLAAGAVTYVQYCVVNSGNHGRPYIRSQRPSSGREWSSSFEGWTNCGVARRQKE